MTFFESIFTCNNSKNNLKDKVDELFRMQAVLSNDLKNLETRLENKIDTLTSRIDTLILVLQNR